jgi:hypothetical protein
MTSSASNSSAAEMPPTPEEADAVRKAQVAQLMAELSDRGRAVVDFISPQLIRRNSASSAVHERHGRAALDEAARIFRFLGWHVQVGYQAGIRGRTVHHNVIPGQYYLKVWK